MLDEELKVRNETTYKETVENWEVKARFFDLSQKLLLNNAPDDAMVPDDYSVIEVPPEPKKKVVKIVKEG